MQKNFSLIAEVPISTSESASEILAKSSTLLKSGFNMLAFSDRARADSKIPTISDLLKLNIFPKINADNLLVVLATRTKQPEELDEIAEALKSQNVKNLLVVTGDPHKNSRSNFLTSLDIIPKLSQSFSVSAAIHADPLSSGRDIKKVNLGASTLIVQACYDSAKWNEWLKKATELGINKTARIYQTVIPLTYKAILETMKNIHDVSIPDSLYNELSMLSENDLMAQGINIAEAQISLVKQNNFFSGVYVYSRDLETMSQISSATHSGN